MGKIQTITTKVCQTSLSYALNAFIGRELTTGSDKPIVSKYVNVRFTIPDILFALAAHTAGWLQNL